MNSINRSSFVRSVAIAALALGMGGRLPADPITLVDTGPGFNPDHSGLLVSNSQWLAGEFTLGDPTTITSIEGWLSISWGHIDIGVTADAGEVPGATLFSGSVTGLNQTTYDWQGITGLNWTLGAGTYWIVFSSQDGAALMEFPASVAPLGNNAYYDVGAGAWMEYDPGSFGLRVKGETSPGVPDNGDSLIMLGAALIGLILIRRLLNRRLPD